MSQPIIILVDDDEAIRQSLRFSLEVEGFTVETYSSAEALEAAGAAPAGCLIIDHHLPGASGLDLLVRLRSQGVTTPAIIITSNPGASLRRAIGQAKATLIEKPLLCDALTSQVRAMLAA